MDPMFISGYAGARHGALTVIETPRPSQEINARLKALDPALFVERQITLAQEHVWCVVVDDGGNGCVTVLEWREPDGTPIPYLSDRIVSEMQRRYQRGPLNVKEIVAENERRVRERQAEHHAQAIELTREHARLAGRELPALRGSSPKVLADRRRKRNTGHYERAGQ